MTAARSRAIRSPISLSSEVISPRGTCERVTDRSVGAERGGIPGSSRTRILRATCEEARERVDLIRQPEQQVPDRIAVRRTAVVTIGPVTA